METKNMPHTCRCNIFHNRFDFGVPLEDIFPKHDIHPNLKLLFTDTYITIRNSYVPLEEIVSEYEGSLLEKLSLKDYIVKGTKYNSLDFSPGTYFWVIRHFLGLLPLPILPIVVDGQRLNWAQLAYMCYINRNDYEKQIQNDITNNISKLPEENRLLMDYLIILFRKLCKNCYDQSKLDRGSLKVITQYFSSSIFCRPYRPGMITKQEKIYYPLTYYIIKMWPKLQRSDAKVFIETKTEESLLTQYHIKTKKQSIGIQTNFNLRNSQIEYIVEKPLKCCCHIGTNYSTKFERFAVNASTSSQKSISMESSNLSKLTSDSFDSKISLKSKINSSEEEEEELSYPSRDRVTEDYLYDDYDTFQHEEFNQIKNVCSPHIIEKENSCQSKMKWKRKISKKITHKINQTNKSLTCVMNRASKKLKLREGLQKCRSSAYSVRELASKLELLKYYSSPRQSTSKKCIKYKKLNSI